MSTTSLLLLALSILAFGLVSGRAQRSILTMPMAFVFFGYLIGEGGLHLVSFPMEEGPIHLLAEITLVVVLFTDAARIDLGLLRREHDLPVRLLSAGMPLTLILGTLAALLILPDLHFWEAALVAAILTPTDAALGQAVVSNKRVPVRIRQALNVESGLNDGIALPAVLILLSVACAVQQSASLAYWIKFAALQVTLGPLVGIAVGYFGGKLLDRGSASGWMSESFRNLASLGLALLAFSAAEMVHGNGFIAAFCAGLILGNTSRVACDVEEFSETEGQLLTLLVFLAFGGAMLPHALEAATPRTWLYALASLTVVRMLPVAISLLGKGLRRDTVFFLGWFGPRGIASILFVLLVVGRTAPGQHEGLMPIVLITVLLSTFLHGITAYPLSNLYARRYSGEDGTAQEEQPVEEMPLRVPDGA